MIEKTFAACDDTLNDALALVEEELERADCPMKAITQITICVEEMYVNVAHYAYGGQNKGDVTLSVGCEDGTVTITLKDTGMAFDPLAKEDPDITLAAEDRKIGGLGIYMVKKTMDSVAYVRENGQNIFTMAKKFA